MGNVEKGETVKNFLKTLADNNRLGILEGVCEKFGVLMSAAKGEMELVVQSASVSFTMAGEAQRGDHRDHSTGLTGDTCLLVMGGMQKLDTKTLQRLETAVAKSEYSQGKKLKVVTKVSGSHEDVMFILMCRADKIDRSIRISWGGWWLKLETGRSISAFHPRFRR